MQVAAHQHGNVIARGDPIPGGGKASRLSVKSWAELAAAARRKEHTLPLLDGTTAATALARGLTVATRNGVDFRLTGVKVHNPFE